MKSNPVSFLLPCGKHEIGKVCKWEHTQIGNRSKKKIVAKATKKKRRKIQ